MESLVFASVGRHSCLRPPMRLEGGTGMKWKNEAMDKLRRYQTMRQALQNLSEEILRLEDEARGIRTVSADVTPVKNGGTRREEMLIDNMLQRQELTWSLEQVKRWLSVCERGLRALTEEERLILQRLYLYPERGSLQRLCQELEVEQSTVYRRRDEALQRFTVALYGFSET